MATPPNPDFWVNFADAIDFSSIGVGFKDVGEVAGAPKGIIRETDPAADFDKKDLLSIASTWVRLLRQKPKKGPSAWLPPACIQSTQTGCPRDP